MNLCFYKDVTFVRWIWLRIRSGNWWSCLSSNLAKDQKRKSKLEWIPIRTQIHAKNI
jgi:hypothetical protein